MRQLLLDNESTSCGTFPNQQIHFFSVAIRWLIRELLNGLAINPKSFSLIRQTVMLEIISLRLVFSRKFHMEVGWRLRLDYKLNRMEALHQ